MRLIKSWINAYVFDHYFDIRIKKDGENESLSKEELAIKQISGFLEIKLSITKIKKSLFEEGVPSGDADRLIAESIKRVRASKKREILKIIYIGGAWFFVSLIASMISFALSVEFGGTAIFTTGPLLYGLYQLFRGVFSLIKFSFKQ